MNKKNILNTCLYGSIAIVIGFILPFLLYYFGVKDYGIITIISYVLIVILFFSQEIVACLITKKVFKETDKLPLCLFIHEIFIFIVLLLLTIKKYDIIFIMVLISLIKLVTWYTARRFIVKEKMSFKLVPSLMLGIYTLLLTIGTNLICPTELNKDLFIKYGETNLSSKDLHIELVEKYNKKVDKKIGYFHVLDSQDLSIITKLYIETTLSNKDLDILKEIKDIHISESVVIDKELDLTNNNLLSFTYLGENIKKIKFNNVIRKIDIYSNIDELNISSSKDLKSLNIDSNIIVIETLSQVLNNEKIDINFKKLINKDNKVILGTNSSKDSLRLTENKINISKDFLVENLYSDIYKIEIKNKETQELIVTGKIPDNCSISLYKDNTLVTELDLIKY